MFDITYAKRPYLRKLEYVWSRIESLVNRLTTPEFNPLYHLGTLSIYLLIIITITGIYLTIIYRPGAEVAYATVESISNHWFGSLMRSIHRYASDGLLLLVIIHALKTLLSDRFWGARWLAWVSGWLLLAASWFIGTTGYWLVWDLKAQWLTEYLINYIGGAVAITFLAADISSSTFVVFVIVLFVHIFLPLSLLVLTIIHILRLTRARIWSPRWALYLSTLALIVLSIWAPVTSAEPANLSRFIPSVDLDAWYLGFLPVIDRYGNLPFWVATLIVFGAFTILPWVSKGKQDGPAVIADPHCTGCALCATECPYRAIEMDYRQDDVSRFKSIAVINSNLCTGCGLCVGTCATMGVELDKISTADVYDLGILAALKSEVTNGEQPVVIFTCQRQAALKTLPAAVGGQQMELTTESKLPDQAMQSPVFLGTFESSKSSQNMNTITCVLPCTGMVDVDWVKELFAVGARDIILVNCPYDDCNYREGPQWLSSRLNRRKANIKPNLHWLEAAPGDQKTLAKLLDQLPIEDEKPSPKLPVFSHRQKRFPNLSISGIVLLLFTFIFSLALPADFTSGSSLVGQSQLRIAVEHSGNVSNQLDTSGVTLPEGASADAAQILGGRKFPVGIQVGLNGKMALEQSFEPRGLRNVGEISGVELLNLPPGEYLIQISLSDDDNGWRILFSDNIFIGAGTIYTFLYDQQSDTFIIH